MSGQDELKNTGKIKMPQEVVNIYLSLETSVSQCVAGSVRDSTQEMYLEIIEAIAIGFSTLLMKNKCRSSQTKSPQPTVLPNPLLLVSLCSFLSDPLSGPLYPKLSTCFEGARLTQLVQLVTAGRLFLGHNGQVDP